MATTKSKKLMVSQVIADFMGFLGIDYCFGVPGSNTSFLYTLQKNGVNLVLTKNESGAAFMASGFTKASGRISSCFGSVGPGAINLLAGVAAAFEDSQPVLVLVGQVPKKWYGKNAFQETSGKNRTVNQHEIFKRVTKFSARINHKGQLLKALKNAFESLTDCRPGPVCLELATDVMDETIQFPEGFFESFRKKKPLIGQEKLNKAVEVIKSAQKPLIIAGGGAVYSNANEEVQELSSLLGWPIATTLKGKGIVSEDSELCLGCVGNCGQTAANEYLNSGVDVVIAIGISFHQHTTKNWTLPFEKAKIIRIDCPGSGRTRNYEEFLALNGGLKETTESLISALKRKKIKPFCFPASNVKQQGFFSYREMNDVSTPLKPQRFVSELRKYLPNDAILCSESVAWTEKYFKTIDPRTHIVCTGLGPIGCSFSEALGAKLSKPDKTVVSIQGDGGFQMGGLEIMTAVNYKIPIIAIILNNGVLGPIYKFQKSKYPSTFISEFENPDYLKLAESCGAFGLRITKDDEIKGKINEALKINKKGIPVLLDVLIEK